MSDHVGSVRFETSNGSALFVAADHVACVQSEHWNSEDCALIQFNSGWSLRVKGTAEAVSKRIDAARSYG